MADARLRRAETPGDSWRPVAARPRGRMPPYIVFGAAVAALLCALTSVWRPPVILLWNVSASAPRGLYLVLPAGKARRGDMLVAWLPTEARALAAQRHYLPAGVPLVKAVAAAAGDRVCARRGRIFINRRFAASRLPADALGRPLPHWGGCVELRPGDYLLLSNHPWSFDGRYFGVTHNSEIIGKAELLWRE